MPRRRVDSMVFPALNPPRLRLLSAVAFTAALLLAGAGCAPHRSTGSAPGTSAPGTSAARTSAPSAARVIRDGRPTWFAPYVDVTLTPAYQFQRVSSDPARLAVLAFIVSDPRSPCTPSWGGAYSLAHADRTLALGARIAELQRDGGQAIVSFGGVSHTSLDVACRSVAALTASYQSVIRAYRLTTVDLDVEGAALEDSAAMRRRARAVAALERAARSSHRRLRVWLTLPVEPSGLQRNAISVIASMLRERVSITGVNLMAMDFAQPPGGATAMAAQVESALAAAHSQLSSLFPRYGVHLRARQLWKRMGATVMIGRNDVPGERFTVADARKVAAFAARAHLGRVSMWSANRDGPCRPSSTASQPVSATCSGTPQSGLEFSRVFARLAGASAAAPTRNG